MSATAAAADDTDGNATGDTTGDVDNTTGDVDNTTGDVASVMTPDASGDTVGSATADFSY